ncbi:MAG: anthranilate synthase component I [Deltaproteobacteria bacterium]|nr:anthranilate synthase component I [Deltaproteobacteria bacterium]
MHTPSMSEFKELAKEGNLIPLYREILADMDTPVSAYKKIARGPYSFLFESVVGGEKWARYSFLGCEPSVIFKSKGGNVEIIENGETKIIHCDKDPLYHLKELMNRYKPVKLPGLPRFFGGAVGYLGYDMVRFFEKLPELTEDDLGLPDSLLMITDTILIFDNVNQKIKVVSNAHTEGVDTEEAYHRAAERVEDMIDRLRSPIPIRENRKRLSKPEEPNSNFSKQAFKNIVEKARDYIREGDIFQVVLSQRFEVDNHEDPFDVYRAIRSLNPSPYLFLLTMDEVSLVGSSPEVLVRVEEGDITLRPIAGTRKRGETEEEDKALEEDLLADPKERAEHIMLVDLGRNDVGRVSQVGSVEVDELMVIERYSHVMHIVSNVKSNINEGLDAYDVLRACFPAGTVSGAPKVRAMEIIEELEPTKRGPYAGAVGYFSFTGNMDICITIRTILIKGDKAYVQAGAGIVAYSDPESEYVETVNKAKGSMRALEIAAGGLNS